MLEDIPHFNDTIPQSICHCCDKWHFMSSYRYYDLASASTQQVDIGGFFSGDKLGTPVSLSNNPQQPWFLVIGLTANFNSNVTNDFRYSYLRNWWAWDRQGDTPQLAGLGGAIEPFGETGTQALIPYNVDTQQTRARFWDGHDNMWRDRPNLVAWQAQNSVRRHVPAQFQLASAHRKLASP